MNKYKWVMELVVEANDEVGAQSEIEEALEEAYVDPDGIFSHGEMTKENGTQWEEIKKEITKHLSSNVALYDCQGDCPEEVAINEELRTPEYCNNCFAEQILGIIKKERG